MLSIKSNWPAAISRLHQITPFDAVAGTTAALYLLLWRVEKTSQVVK
jgi:hypothetical protein